MAHESDDTYRLEHLRLPGKEAEAAESETSWRACEKHPDHEMFTPIGDFNLQHLPQELQSQANLEYIQTATALTVRLRIREVSSMRPAEGFFSVNGPCLGTGFIWEAVRSDGVCMCDNCRSGPRAKTSWLLKVQTAKHVVFDAAEARCTIADLFFDDKASRTDGRMKKVEGVGLEWTDDFTDWCFLYCATHDMELGSRVKSYMTRWKELYNSLKEEAVESDVVWVVSHPHGQPKQVTVGKTTHEEDIGRSRKRMGTRHTYSAQTCPGSSGAFVVSVWKPKAGWNWWAVHSMQGETSGWNEGFR